MLLARLSDRHPFQSYRSEIDRFFGGSFDLAPVAPRVGRRLPALNVTETDKSYVAEVEVPGWKMSELELSVQGDELTIKGQRAESSEAKGEDVTFLRRERSETGFHRVLQLPVEVDTAKVEASLKDGVLTIKLPKAQAVLPRKIEVKG